MEYVCSIILKKRRFMLSPNKIAETAVEVGKKKAELSALKMVLLGIFAGMFIALAGVGATLGSAYGGKVVGACIFPAGLAMVVIAGSELFTGNNLMVAALFTKKISKGELLRNWVLVFLGNFIGAILVAFLAVISGVLDGVGDAVVTAATNKFNLDFIEAFVRGILCNFLVCIAVWMAFGAETVTGKIIAVFFPIMLFVLCGFEHSVADMFYGPAGIFMAIKNGVSVEGLNVGAFLFQNLLPVTLGNIVGGAGLVGGGYYLIYLKNKK